jgi:hypothetical protein
MNNKHIIDMASALGIPESTLRRIRKQSENLHERRGSAPRTTVSRNTTDSDAMEKLELMLAQWIEHQRQCAIIIQP